MSKLAGLIEEVIVAIGVELDGHAPQIRAPQPPLDALRIPAAKALAQPQHRAIDRVFRRAEVVPERRPIALAEPLVAHGAHGFPERAELGVGQRGIVDGEEHAGNLRARVGSWWAIDRGRH